VETLVTLPKEVLVSLLATGVPALVSLLATPPRSSRACRYLTHTGAGRAGVQDGYLYSSRLYRMGYKTAGRGAARKQARGHRIRLYQVIARNKGGERAGSRGGGP
jgi:hypothetical protein